jgi:hypothetical protein
MREDHSRPTEKPETPEEEKTTRDADDRRTGPKDSA